MDVKRFEIFLKILETKNFSEAAAALGMAQPSVSSSLKALEEALGCKLFDRTSRWVKPLHKAYALAPYARKMVDTLDEANLALSRAEGPKESLTVGASSAPALAIIPEALSRFSADFPEALLKLKAGKSEDIIRRVIDGEFDVGLVGLPPASPYLNQEIIASDAVCLLAPEEMLRDAKAPPASLDDLADWSLIMREDGSGTKAAFLKAFAKRPDLLARLKIVAEVEGLLPALTLARAGLGAVVASSLSERAAWLIKDLKIIPLDFLGLGRYFYLITRKHHKLSPLAKAFIKTVKKDSDQG
ncbi:MAG: LysR family transcriptional regulator [Deltaproteobacteria bacterium]|jgi:DNA-binding transcriptional LysR family regulator|nr:LysR family transcriptional regulator [Deltaproteobacteria bacterium]